MDNREAKLEAALREVRDAALKQLSGMGKGREPSPRLQEAVENANELLGER